MGVREQSLTPKKSTILLSLLCIYTIASIIGEPLIRLQISLEFGSFLKGCSFNQSLTYGKEHVSKMGRVPVFASCGISPSPYLSFKRICLIFNKVNSGGLASKSHS